MDLSSHPVLIVMAIAVAASLLAEIRLRVRVPVAVWEMVLGILVGPFVLALVRPDALIDWLGRIGLGALFFMAGMDLDLQKVKGRPLSLALQVWILSLALGFVVAVFLHVFPFVDAPIMVALALTTTAMGTFMPILRDAGRLDSKFGIFVIAAGAVGEFGPVVVVSLVLTRMFGAWQELALILGFVVVAFLSALVALRSRSAKISGLFERGMHSSTQFPVCIALLFLATFDVLSTTIGLEAVLGAFSAGMVVGLASRGEAGTLFREKMEAICFGFFVPFFFVVSGIRFDLGAFRRSPRTMLLVPIFLVLFLVVRGAPVFLYRNDVPKEERWPLALYSATALPMVVAIASIGVRTGRMPTDIAAALVGAGLFSVLLFPTMATTLLNRMSASA